LQDWLSTEKNTAADIRSGEFRRLPLFIRPLHSRDRITPDLPPPENYNNSPRA
jgi:hypothetical protein